MKVREITPDDHSDWLRMRRSLFSGCSESMHALEMKEFSDSTATRAVFVVERRSGGLCGFIELSIRDRVDASSSRQVAYVEGWYIDPDHRGRGLGRALIKQAEAWTTSRSLTELASDAEVENRDSIHAHKALGFRETFRLVHFLKRVGKDV